MRDVILFIVIYIAILLISAGLYYFDKKHNPKKYE